MKLEKHIEDFLLILAIWVPILTIGSMHTGSEKFYSLWYWLFMLIAVIAFKIRDKWLKEND